MASAQTDWTWQALIQSLQSDIAHLRDLMDEARRETAQARDIHRRELDALIEQLREVKSHLEPILTEREAAKKARNEMLWGWAGRGGWVLIAAAGFAIWHYLTKHMGGE